jgi:hypothetical protein
MNRKIIYLAAILLITLAAGAEFSDSFELIPCSGCTTDGGLYFYVIVWQKTSSGKYAYVNGKVLK